MLRIMATASLTALFTALTAQAEDVQQPDATIPKITIIADVDAYKTLPGAGTYLSPTDLEVFQDTDINAILEQVPGVFVTEEDGYGLRPNIGIRAAQSERSSKVTYMEDGILMNPAPYAQPSAYYFPRAGRMHSIEVVKGPASTKFGPYTIGGAINMNTVPIPRDSLNKIRLELGEDGGRLAHLQHGQSVGRGVSYVLDAYREEADGFKQLDNGGDTGFEIGSVMGKLRYSLDNQYFEMKLGYTDEVSDETYWGLTDSDFAKTPFRRYAGTQRDEMDNEHRQAVFTHVYDFESGSKLTTQIYKTWFDRNWYKLESVGGKKFDDVMMTDDDERLFNVLNGNRNSTTTCPAEDITDGNDCLYVKANNRLYKAHGIQTKLNFDINNHAVEIGIRAHTDEMKRVQWTDKYYMEDGVMRLYGDPGVPGAAGGGDNRFEEAKALSLYISDEIDFGRLTVTPGLRMEDIKGVRYEGNGDQSPRSAIKAKNSYDDLMGALSVTYQLNDETLLIGGIYEGFSPTGVANEKAETATIFEAGVRWHRGVHNIEAFFHQTNFDNLVVTCTNSAGGTCPIGDTFSSDAAEVFGLELIAGTQFEAGALTVPVSLVYSYTHTEFLNSFDEASEYSQWGEVTAGDAFPYVPENQLAVSIGLISNTWQADARVKYKSEMRTKAGQGHIADPDKIDSHTVVDLALTRDMGDNLQIKLGVRNALDKDYAVSRHPAGLRPGLPRTASLSMRKSF